MLCYSTDSHRHVELLISFHVICGSNTFRGVLQGTLPRDVPAARSRRRRCASADAVRSAPASAVAPPRRITGGPNTPGMSGDGDAGWFDGSRCRSGVGDPRGAPRGGGMGSRRRGSARPVAAIYMAATASSRRQPSSMDPICIHIGSSIARRMAEGPGVPMGGPSAHPGGAAGGRKI